MTVGDYLPILILVILATGFAVASIVVASFLSPRAWSAAKVAPYECGITPEGTDDDERDRFPVKFYAIAMMFIVFDIEVAFLFPWAVAFDELAVFGLVQMGIFLAILVAVYAYEWKRGGLEWAE